MHSQVRTPKTFWSWNIFVKIWTTVVFRRHWMSIRMNSINLKLLTCTLIFVQNPYFSLFHTCCPVKFTMIRVSNTIATTHGTIVLLAGDTTNTFVLFRVYFDTLLARGTVECATVFFYNDKRRKYPMNTKLNITNEFS